MNPLQGKLLPAVRGGGFRMKDKMIWCGSVIRGEDGRYHMFASLWERSMGFGANWLYHCRIVRAASDRPEGPFRLEQVVLEERSPRYFDGRNTHNPFIAKYQEKYYLYYMGTTYFGEISPDNNDHALFTEVWNRKRIGLAVSDSVFGPWERRDEPILLPRDCSHWDCTATTNPAVTILPDGSTYMLYKSRSCADAPLQIGAARADSPDGEFYRLSDSPIEGFGGRVEDPFLWYSDGRFRLLIKDDNPDGRISGEWGAGFYAESRDCVHWEVEPACRVYSRTISWDDGSTTTQPNLERPFLLLEEGVPTHLYLATGDGDRPYQLTHSYNICIPLKV